jgi:hypothetical protein
MNNYRLLQQNDRSSGSNGSSYNSRYLDPSYSFDTDQLNHQPFVSHDGVRFTILVEDTPFEFAITRQALEDVDGKRLTNADLGDIFFRHRERIEGIANALINAGVSWPNLVIRMQDIEEHSSSR